MKQNSESELRRTVPKDTLLLTLMWNKDNQWTGIVEDTKVKVKCEDFRKDVSGL